MMNRKFHTRPGYVFLISVLAIGVISSAAVLSLLLLGGAAERTAYALQQSAQAFENAQTCTERALLSLRSDLTYPGGETFTLANGTCTIHAIGGIGSMHRTLCAEGNVEGTIRRAEVQLDRLFPNVEVSLWQEVSSFTLCP